MVHRIVNQSGVSHLTLELSRLIKSPTFSATTFPLSRSCQTPKAINPSVLITTVVVLRNSITKLLSAWSGPVNHGLQTAGAYLSGGGGGWGAGGGGEGD